jgi:amino acid transporter
MEKTSNGKPLEASLPRTPRVMVATTALLTFISFWRAAAIVLNDLASSAFYAGGIVETAIGKAAPWFILGIMLFSFIVLQIYVESCSMFVRGGVYRVVKEAMGGTLAKFSVSALMFDYVLTGPISGVSAGQYLVGFINELLSYAHMHYKLPLNSSAATFAIIVTLYFWWQNIKGIEESSDKALKIMEFTTVLVVVMIGWCGYTLWVRGGHLPPLPTLTSLRFDPEALGWLRHMHVAETIAVVGILVGLGHSVLAMSGLESMAQVYREIQHPKLPNLKKAGWVVFVYSLLFTSLVSFFAVMIIPDNIRKGFADNLIGGLAMNVVGPLPIRLVFHAFVVVVGILILSGAVNTAIVGSNGVLNRVSEDGVLAAWFRQPHPRYGTSSRIINLVVALQILTLIVTHGNIILLGEAYAFGVIWSFVMKGAAVLLLRFKEPGPREYRVPLNFRIGGLEYPVGLALITLALLAIAVTNLFTKEVATVAGITFTVVLFVVFTASEKLTHRSGGDAHMDQFHVASREEISPTACDCRPGNVLVLVRDPGTLYNLSAILDRVRPDKQDVVVLHIRMLMRSASGESGLTADQLFTATEQELFTKALSIAEKRGKTVKLAVAAATSIWDGILRAAQNLNSSAVVLGLSAKMPITEEARRAGAAWEQLPAPRPNLTLEIFTPTGREEVFYLGPHSPHLTPKEIDLLHSLWLRFSGELAPAELHHHDIVHFALDELEREIQDGQCDEVRDRLKRHLEFAKNRRITNT